MPFDAERSDGDLSECVAFIIKHSDTGRRNRAEYVYVSVNEGVVTLFGVVQSRRAAQDIEATVRKRIGEVPIRNHIRRAPLFPDW